MWIFCFAAGLTASAAMGDGFFLHQPRPFRCRWHFATLAADLEELNLPKKGGGLFVMALCADDRSVVDLATLFAAGVWAVEIKVQKLLTETERSAAVRRVIAESDAF